MRKRNNYAGFWLIVGMALGWGLPLIFCDLGR